MSGAMRRAVSGGLVVFVALSAGAGVALAWKNLTVLPNDISPTDLDATMTRMSTALGVGCGHCHTSKDAPESDDLPAKTAARQMITMTVALNRDFFGYEKAPLVTCLTCHQGQTTPRTRLPLADPAAPRPAEREVTRGRRR